MSRIRITGDGSPAGTRIFIDDVEQTDIAAYELRQAARTGALATLVLHVNVTGLEVETDADVKFGGQRAADAFAMVQNERVVSAIGSLDADVTQGVNIPRMALRYVTLPYDVRLTILLTLGLISPAERESADSDDDVRRAIERDALGRALEAAAIAELDKAINAAIAMSQQQGGVA
jgi:hypothetical protein